MIVAGQYSGSRKLYRSRRGVILGVCQGFADWAEISVGMVRLIAVIALIFTGLFPLVLIYFLMGIFLPLEPAYRDDGRTEGRRRWSGGGSFEDDLNDLKGRVNRMEDEEFDKEREWDDKFRNDSDK
jgi:phage shock protein C